MPEQTRLLVLCGVDPTCRRNQAGSELSPLSSHVAGFTSRSVFSADADRAQRGAGAAPQMSIKVENVCHDQIQPAELLRTFTVTVCW